MRKKNKKVSLAKKPFLVLSRKAIAGWLVAAFFICAWMFVIGILVGRGTSPLKFDINKLQKELQIATEKLKQKEKNQSDRKGNSPREKPELEFYEALKKDRQETDIAAAPAPPPPAKKSEPPPPKTSATSKKTSMKRRTKTGSKATVPVESARKTPKAASVPPSEAPRPRAESADRPYAIQVAAFKAAGDADKMVAELKQKGFAAYRRFDKIPNKGIWYRVRVGDYKNKAEAGGIMAKLKKAGYKGMLVKK